MKILLATRNTHKIEEIKAKLAPFSSFEWISLDEIAPLPEVEETGDTFEGNALLKAETYASLSGMMCLADDSGLEIDALNGQPGIHSARFLGIDTSYIIKNQHLLTLMENQSQRSARYVAVVALARPHQKGITFKGTVEGSIAYAASGDFGFGFDPIFIPEHESKPFAHMSLQQKNQFSHRGRALEACMAYLMEQEYA